MSREVTSDDTRPAGRQDECFYCHEAIGSTHDVFCVLCSTRPVTITITKLENGEKRSYDSEEYFGPEGWSNYSWAEGNSSCDCNRKLFFERAGGLEPDFGDLKCGDGSYLVNTIVLKETGEILYAENEETSNH